MCGSGRDLNCGPRGSSECNAEGVTVMPSKTEMGSPKALQTLEHPSSREGVSKLRSCCSLRSIFVISLSDHSQMNKWSSV